MKIEIPHTAIKKEIPEDYHYLTMDCIGKWWAHKAKPTRELDWEELCWVNSETDLYLVSTPALISKIDWKVRVWKIKDCIVGE